jgi:hypothetical protein
MNSEPSKYAAECQAAFESTQARAVLLIVLDGNRGTGFAGAMTENLQHIVPHLLRSVAEQIEKTESNANPRSETKTRT